MCALALQVAWLERSFHDDPLFLQIPFNHNRDFDTKPRACLKGIELALINEASRQQLKCFEDFQTYWPFSAGHRSYEQF